MIRHHEVAVRVQQFRNLLVAASRELGAEGAEQRVGPQGVALLDGAGVDLRLVASEADTQLLLLGGRRCRDGRRRLRNASQREGVRRTGTWGGAQRAARRATTRRRF